jgi:4-hydroxybenzoate polyprenyltransferase
MIKGLLKILRPLNLFIIALAQYLIKYAFLEPLNVDTSLNSVHFGLLVISTLSIAAGGYIINDIFDIQTDSINKPGKLVIGISITEKQAYQTFIAFMLLGVGIGFYISNYIEKPSLAAIFVLFSVLLYVYASYLKKTFLVGNFVVSILVGCSLLIVGLFELFPTTTELNQFTQTLALKKVVDYSIFAFMINILREVVKDIEDIKGDKEVGMKTLPIVLGREKAIKLVSVLSFIPIIAVTYYLINYLYNQQIVVIYFLLLIIAPMLIFTIKSFSAKSKTDFSYLSKLLKFIMLTGVLSLILYPIILN